MSSVRFTPSSALPVNIISPSEQNNKRTRVIPRRVPSWYEYDLDKVKARHANLHKNVGQRQCLKATPEKSHTMIGPEDISYHFIIYISNLPHIRHM